jgi:PIN domain nuclease of toxin-antitoxin system
MKLLLDTHVFIWLDTNLNKISPKVLALCENPDNQLYLSVVSA